MEREGKSVCFIPLARRQDEEEEERAKRKNSRVNQNVEQHEKSWNIYIYKLR